MSRPSGRWGRLDLSLVWRRVLDQPRTTQDARADELWLLAVWSR